MGLKSSTITGWACIASIVLVLVGLATIPKLFEQKEFRIQAGAGVTALPPSVSLDRKFSVLEVKDGKASSRRMATLKELMPVPNGNLIVNFWATWCPPCVQEMPALDAFNQQLEAAAASKKNDFKLRLVTISVDEKMSDVAGLYATLDYAPSFLVLFDPSGEFAMSLGTAKFPETYWISSSGRVEFKWPGPQEWLSNDVLSRIRSLASLKP